MSLLANTSNRPRVHASSPISSPRKLDSAGGIRPEYKYNAQLPDTVIAERSTNSATLNRVSRASHSYIKPHETALSQLRRYNYERTMESGNTYLTDSKLYRRSFSLRPRLRITGFSAFLPAYKAAQKDEKRNERRRLPRYSLYDRIIQTLFFVCLVVFLHALSGTDLPLGPTSNTGIDSLDIEHSYMHTRPMPFVRYMRGVHEKLKARHEVNHPAIDPEGHYSSMSFGNVVDSRRSDEKWERRNSTLEEIRVRRNPEFTYRVMGRLGIRATQPSEDMTRISEILPSMSIAEGPEFAMPASKDNAVKITSNDNTLGDLEMYPYPYRIRLPRESSRPVDHYRRKRRKAQPRTYDGV